MCIVMGGHSCHWNCPGRQGLGCHLLNESAVPFKLCMLCVPCWPCGFRALSTYQVQRTWLRSVLELMTCVVCRFAAQLYTLAVGCGPFAVLATLVQLVIDVRLGEVYPVSFVHGMVTTVVQYAYILHISVYVYRSVCTCIVYTGLCTWHAQCRMRRLCAASLHLIWVMVQLPIKVLWQTQLWPCGCQLSTAVVYFTPYQLLIQAPMELLWPFAHNMHSVDDCELAVCGCTANCLHVPRVWVQLRSKLLWQACTKPLDSAAMLLVA